MNRPDTWAVLPLLQQASGYLQSKGVESARLEAEMMLAAALGLRRLDLYLQFDKVLTPAEVEIFRGYVRERLGGRPVQYITGDAAFRLIELRVDERVLVPRPETEILVDQVLAFLPSAPAGPILDVGCGSGAIALAIAGEASRGAPPTHDDAPEDDGAAVGQAAAPEDGEGVRVLASDISAAALAVARGNAERCGVGERVRFLCGDLLSPLAPGGRFAVIVSNPPYIARPDLDGLQVEVRDHEPHLALDGGPDGLDVIRRLVAASADHLLPGGRLFLEVGSGQADEVAALLVAAELVDVHVQDDLAGVPRVVSGSRASLTPGA